MKINLTLTILTVVGISHAVLAIAQTSTPQLDQFAGEYKSPQWEINRVCQPDLKVTAGESQLKGVSIMFGESPVFDFKNINGGAITSFENDTWGSHFRYKQSVKFDASGLSLVNTKQISQRFIIWTDSGTIYTSVSMDLKNHSLHLKEWDSAGYVYSDCTYRRK